MRISKTAFSRNYNQMGQMNVVRSRKHVVYSERVNKVALSGEDDKRII